MSTAEVAAVVEVVGHTVRMIEIRRAASTASRLGACAVTATPVMAFVAQSMHQVTHGVASSHSTSTSTDERLDAALALDAAHAVSPDQRLLRVLLTDDQSAFERPLDERLAQHRADTGEHPAPETLLPLGAIALAVLAVQVHGWDLQTRSAYLPASLFKPPAPVGS
ncbi:Imm49 family immunity protein [Streptomyces erythrochromogenes]|uniref:Imm49 family immunity protein n=1 Tax=Streptomyces erythrochromogenes TaxID=285574 RepID=UPI003685B61F